LGVNSWAEHKDGSLVRVDGLEGDSVIFSVIRVDAKPALEYRDAMALADFNKEFSPGNKLGLTWTWHDKTPFPWDRVMKVVPSGTKAVSVQDTMSAAQRVGEDLQLRAEALRDRDAVDPVSTNKGVMQIAEGLASVLRSLRP
jgi:hypothetical protein